MTGRSQTKPWQTYEAMVAGPVQVAVVGEGVEAGALAASTARGGGRTVVVAGPPSHAADVPLLDEHRRRE